MNFFAIAQFHINPQEGEISHIYKFKRVDESWVNVATFTQESGYGDKEVMKNCFQIREKDLELFLHFTDEHMTVLNSETGYQVGKRVNYRDTIDKGLE